MCKQQMLQSCIYNSLKGTLCIIFRDEIVQYEEPTAPDNGETVGERERESEMVVQDDKLRLGPPGPPFGIVINGSSLVSRLALDYIYSMCNT